MEKQKKLKWKAIGRSLKNGKVTDGDIEILESEGICMEGAETYGVPINARLAISMIGNLWKAVKGKEVQQKSADGFEKQNYDLIDKVKADLERGNKEVIIDVVTELQRKLAEKDYWLDELLMQSFAITFDRSILLKTLSQPGCEGVRFYLCMKYEGEMKVFKERNVLSLVAVGVDKFGVDLNYSHDPTKHEHTDVETCSLTVEYGKSAKMLCFDLKDDRLNPYVLFKYALPYK